MLIKFAIFAVLVTIVSAGRECIWVLGRLECQKDPTKIVNVEVRAWDRDGVGPIQLIDPDDLMGVTFSNDDGRFQLDGCADDFDWIPGVSNAPEPYIQIRHYCNSAEGELMTLPEFSTFVPTTHDLGIVILDKETRGTKTTAKTTEE